MRALLRVCVLDSLPHAPSNAALFGSGTVQLLMSLPRSASCQPKRGGVCLRAEALGADDVGPDGGALAGDAVADDDAAAQPAALTQARAGAAVRPGAAGCALLLCPLLPK